MGHLPDAKSLALFVQKAFPHSQILRTWPLSGGISTIMVALEIRLGSGQTKKVIVRAPAHVGLAENEYRLLQILQAQAVKAPAPYWLDQFNKTALIIIDYLEGEMCFTPADLDNHMRQLANQLAQIHSLDLSQHDVTLLTQNDGECVEMHRERPSPNSNFPQETEIRTLLAAESVPARSNKIALLHGDFWPGNSLWQNGQLTAVIDWEDALLGDPLIDLAQSRSEIVWIFGPDALECFTRHYQRQMPLDYSALPYWDLCAALRQIRLVGDDLAGFADYFGGYGRADITPQTICQNLNTFINNALTRLNH
jgi:aminoglycoside phosphotransferase (APT) family kinase protein